jgi:hypothetical protein
MIKNTFFFLGLIVLSSLNAQTAITITSADMPASSLLTVSDSVLIDITNSAGTNDPTLAGPNFNLDYSSLISTGQRYETFDAPSSFTSPFNLIFNIFNTTYGKENKAFAAVAALGITGAYDFFKVSGSQLKKTGSGLFVNGAPIPFLYTSADVMYKFPMHFSNQDSCDFKYGVAIPTVGYYGETGHRVNVVDGWGTLKTPAGIFQTLRIKSTVDATDTIYLSALSPLPGTNIHRPLRTEYKWFANGKKIPVLEIDVTSGVTSVQYINAAMIGIDENSEDKFNMLVFPNPSVNQVSVNYLLQSTTNVKISIIDIVGKTVANVSDQKETSGTHQKLINTDDYNLSKGVYFLNLQANDYTEVKKIVVE